MVKVHQLVAAIATTITLSTTSAYALNMGSISWKSSYGQPLNARIELSDAKNLQANDIKPKIANSNDFSKAGLEYTPELSNLKFSTTINPDGTGYITITSTSPIKEPFINFLIDVNWPNGKVSKEYTILLDIPDTKITSSEAKSSSTKPNTVSNIAPASTTVHAADTYKIQRGDTLWSIAINNYGKALASKASRAIFEKNPKAFINGNINSLLNGYTLQMPSSQEVKAISIEQANAFLGSPSKETPVTSKKPIVDKQEQALQDQLKNSEKELETAHAENSTLSTELENIESEITRLEQISKEKDEAIAKAEQAKLAAAQKAQQDEQSTKVQTTTATQETKKPITEQPTTKAPVEPTPQVQAAATKPTEQNTPKTPVEPKPQQQATKTNVEPVKVPTQQPLEDTSPSFISSLLDNNLILLAGGGVLLLLCAAAIIARRKKAADDDAQVVDLSNIVLNDDDLKDSIPETDSLPTKVTDTDTSSPISQLGEGMGVIDKVDIYLAYNHHDEAKELLSNALLEDPTNTELRLKLMEIYADKGETDNFEKEEQELLLLDPLSQHKIDAIKEKYPTSFHDFSFSHAPTPIKNESANKTPDEEPDFSFSYADFAEPTSELTQNDAKPEEALVVPEVKETTPAVGLLEDDITDFKLEKVAPNEQSTTTPLFNATIEEDFSSDSPTTIFEKEDEHPKESNEAIKFDLGFNDQKSDNNDYISQIESNDLDDIMEKDQVTTKLELVHAYMGMGDIEGAQDLLKEIIQEGNESQKIEAQSLLTSLDTASSSPDTTSHASKLPQENVDHELFNTVDPSNTALTELELGFELPPEDEVSTKLELANAYIEMGDKQGAKDILAEVLNEGNTEQRAKAQDLLQSIS